MEKKRYVWPDIAKGLASIFVILMHLPKPNPYSSFLIPVFLGIFFFVSGFISKKQEKIIPWILKMLKDFLIYGTIVVLISYFFGFVDLKKGLIGLVLQDPKSQYPDTLWFVACSIIAKILFNFSISEKIIFTIFKSLFLFIIGIVAMIYVPISIPWHVVTSLLIQILFLGGYLSRIFFTKIKLITKYDLVFFSLILFYIVIIMKYPTDFDLHTLTFQSVPLDIFLILIASPIFFLFCIRMESIKNTIVMNKIIYIGKNSLFFYSFEPFARYFTQKFFESEEMRSTNLYFSSLLLTFFSVVLLYITCKIKNSLSLLVKKFFTSIAKTT